MFLTLQSWARPGDQEPWPGPAVLSPLHQSQHGVSELWVRTNHSAGFLGSDARRVRCRTDKKTCINQF